MTSNTGFRRVVRALRIAAEEKSPPPELPDRDTPCMFCGRLPTDGKVKRCMACPTTYGPK